MLVDVYKRHMLQHMCIAADQHGHIIIVCNSGHVQMYNYITDTLTTHYNRFRQILDPKSGNEARRGPSSSGYNLGKTDTNKINGLMWDNGRLAVAFGAEVQLYNFL